MTVWSSGVEPRDAAVEEGEGRRSGSGGAEAEPRDATVETGVEGVEA